MRIETENTAPSSVLELFSDWKAKRFPVNDVAASNYVTYSNSAVRSSNGTSDLPVDNMIL